MNSITTLRLSLSFFLLITFGVSFAQVTTDSISNDESYEWQLVKKRKGIEIYLRAVEGTTLKQCKAVTTINAPAKDILALLTTPEKNPEWIPNYKDSRTLKRVNDNEYYSYTHVITAFYAQNRDIVFNTSFRKLPSGFIIKSVGVPDYIPEEPGYVRIPQFDVNWIAKEEGRNRTKLTQHLIVSPGGNVSDRLANSTLGNSAYKTILSLKTRFEGEKAVARQE